MTEGAGRNVVDSEARRRSHLPAASCLCSGSHWCGTSGQEGIQAVLASDYLLLPVQVPAAPPAGAWTLSYSAHVQVPLLFLLQELRFHHGPLLGLASSASQPR